MRPFEEKRVRFAPAEASGEHPREASLGRANPGKRGKPEATPRRVKAERKTGDSKENQDENTTTGENQQRQKKRKTRVEKKMYGAQIFSKFINTGSKHNRTETCINLHVSHRLMSTAPAIAKPPPPASCEHGSREGSRDFSSVWTPLLHRLATTVEFPQIHKIRGRFNTKSPPLSAGKNHYPELPTSGPSMNGLKRISRLSKTPTPRLLSTGILT